MIRRLKATIYEELLSVRSQIHQQVDIINQCVEHLNEGRVLPARRVKNISIGYDSYIQTIYAHLTREQRNLLHLIYGKLEIADVTLDGFEDNIKYDINLMGVQGATKKYLGTMRDMKKNYERLVPLIDSYLINDPVDVYYIEDELAENQNSKE